MVLDPWAKILLGRYHRASIEIDIGMEVTEIVKDVLYRPCGIDRVSY